MELSHWSTYIGMTNEQLSGVDLAALNLACAVGLPGSEVIDLAGCFAWFDNAVSLVKRWTDAAYKQSFQTAPADYDHSEEKFKVASLVSCLQRRCGLRYDPSKRAAKPRDPIEFSEMFIHGAIQGPGGTCATLPVVYAAVGRRLGYPIRLATARRHLFCRWDDPANGCRFNFDGSGEGVSDPDDNYFRNWPAPLTREDEQRYGYLRSMTPRRELAVFVGNRGFRYLDCGRFMEAFRVFHVALALDETLGHPSPHDVSFDVYKSLLVDTLRLWQRRLAEQHPPGFPRIEMVLQQSPRRFPMIPWALEREFLTLNSVQSLLHDPHHRKSMWQPLREGRRPSVAIPAAITIDLRGVRDVQSIDRPLHSI